MELRDYIRILRKNWMVILVLALVGVGLAAAYTLTRTPLYSSTSKVFVSTESTGTISDLQQGNAFTQDRVTGYVNVVNTALVLTPVLSELDLSMTVGQLAGRISATVQPNSPVMWIEVTDPDPVLAAELANAVAASLGAVVSEIETPNDESVSPVRLTTLEQATPGFRPVSPNAPLNLVLGALLGIVLGVGVAILREVLDTRIRNERDVRLVTDAPIVGGISYDPKAKDRPLIVQEDPRSPRAESFRALRTNLQFVDIDSAKSFVVTSSIQSEGKSTTTANLALALADAGHRVILIDADLRRPKIDRYLGLEGGAGLSDILVGRASLSEVVQRWGEAGLFVLPAGTVPPNPSELLGSGQMVKLIEHLEASFDFVLFDTPPLLPVTDAAILAKAVGGSIVVVAVSRTNRGQLEGSLHALEQVGARLAGLVLTMIPTKGPDAYGYGRYGYSQYGYGPAYTQNPKKKAREKAAAAASSD